MNQAYWVTEITVEDPETRLPVELSVYKHQNGGMFAVDSSYVEQVLGSDDDVDKDVVMQDPLSVDGLVGLIELPEEAQE